MLQTYQTKIKNSDTSYLDKVSSYFGYIERKLFVDSFIRGKSRTSCKNKYLKNYDITARQYNSIYINLEGKVNSFLEINKHHLSELKDKIKSVKTFINTNTEKKVRLHKNILRLEKTEPYGQKFRKTVKEHKNIKFLIHQKKRKLADLEQKLVTLKKILTPKELEYVSGADLYLKNNLIYKRINMLLMMNGEKTG